MFYFWIFFQPVFTKASENLSGEKSIMYQDEKFSIMYHVSTMLPRSVAEEEEQQIRRYVKHVR